MLELYIFYPVKCRLVRADNQWRMNTPPLIKVSLYWKGDEINGSSFSGKSISNVYCFTDFMFILFL
ncbi:hypothetical protein CWB34_12310 [Bacillus cereus]|nr:hypothetical protein [Bacillus cereus]